MPSSARPSYPGATLPRGGDGLESADSAQRPFWRRLVLPASLIILGVGITLIDGAYAASTGEVLSVGPLRPAWVAGGLVLIGIGVLVYTLLGSDD